MAKYITRDGRKVRVSEYDLSLMLTLKDVIPNDADIASKYLVKKPDAPIGKLRALYNTRDNTGLVRKIFVSYLKKVLVEVANGNCQFSVPGRGSSSPSIYMGFLNDTVVKKRRQNNQFKHFDLIKTGFKVPLLHYKLSPNSKSKDYGIYVNKKIYSHIIDHANSGGHFSTLPRDVDYFLPYIFNEFAYLSENKLVSLLKYCFSKLHKAMKLGEEIRILDKDGEIRFFRQLGKSHDEIMTEVMKKRLKREREYKYGTIS